MGAIRSFQEGVLLVDSFDGPAEEFELVVPHELLDPVGITMAIIMDHVLSRGWWPAGFVDKEGCRVYRYQEMREE